LRVVITLTVAAGIVLSSVIAYLDQASRLRDEHVSLVNIELNRLSDLTALALREPLWQFVPEQADSIIEAAFVNPDVLAITVWDDKGIEFSKRERSDASQTEVTAATRGIEREGNQVGKLTIRMSTSGYLRKLEAARIQYVRSGLLLAVPALIVILFLLHWRLVRPLDTLVTASRLIEAGQLEAPIHAVFEDEIGILAVSLESTRNALLELVAELERRNRALIDANETLELRVNERTASLQGALQKLELAQQEIVETEKLASLGRVVAGVAHELNTPIGNALTVVSSMEFDLTELRTQMLQGALRRSALDLFIDRSAQGAEMATANLKRAAQLIADFKQVAVDQSSDQRRNFNVSEVTREVLNMLLPTLRKAGVELQAEYKTDKECDSYPGRYTQVLTNLVMNAVNHAFVEIPSKKITVRIDSLADSSIRVSVIDNGVGMSDDVKAHIFDPFFTTKMGRGGTGLGMHIVHSIVSRVLGGHVTVHSEVGHGSHIEVEFSCVAPMSQH
jgi:signal transduction histidine kinase